MFILLFMILILLSVAFYTLLERKIISLEQNRLGPDKLIVSGILQPVFDGLKLFLKNINSITGSYLMFFVSPIFSFIFSFSVWFTTISFSTNHFFIFFLFFLSMGVYTFVLSGWSSISKFGYIGGVRASSQTVSYEVGLTLLIVSIFFLSKNLNLNFKEELMFFYLFFFASLYLIMVIAETNRAPFDFSEGESELISGFNIEYGSSGFVLFFLSEYGMMIFFSFLMVLFFNVNKIFFIFFLVILVKLRCTMPRYRYDFLMKMMWFILLPILCFFSIIFILI